MFSLLTDRQWLWGAGAFYLGGLLVGSWSLQRGARPSGILVYGLLVVGYLLQNAGLYVRGHAVGGCPLGNQFEFLQFIAWSAISLYLVVGVTFRSSLLGYLTAGLGAAITLWSLAVHAWDATRRSHIFGGNPWIEFHAALALFSYGVFGLLALTSLLLVFRLYSLKSRDLTGWFARLPSVLDLDHIGIRLLGTGVALLAASLAVGSAYWLRDTASVSWPKLLITIGVWLAYALALALRLRGVLVGRRLAWSCVVLFLTAMLSLWPVNASRHPSEVAPIRG
jgi:HemX protein